MSTLLRIPSRPVAIAACWSAWCRWRSAPHAALNKRALDADKAATAVQAADVAKKGSRIALVIGNGHYPDANDPLAQPDQRRPRALRRAAP